jgi:hypothetical protein
MAGRPPPRDRCGDHQEFNVDPSVSYSATLGDVNINGDFGNIAGWRHDDDFVFQDQSWDDDYHSVWIPNLRINVDDDHTTDPQVISLPSRQKPCKVKKGQGPEGKLQMPHYDRNYDFQFGPTACFLRDHNITIKATELAKIIRNIRRKLKREGMTISNLERVHVKVKSAMYALLDRNWDILHQHFEEEIAAHIRPNF